jgi:hypothetical protein
MNRNIFFCVVLLSMLPSKLAHADGAVDLGPVDRVTALFSYPNCQSNCKATPTLEETVTHYFTQSLQRDGFADSTVSVTKSAGGHIVATFVGSAAVVYPSQVTRVLQAGNAGLKAVRRLQADNEWRNDWRFFLPLGLAWVKHPTLEILIFPPDYTLNRDQDYLAAQTTERWSDLLVSEGLTREESDRYQDIIDIAPIAAPHDCMGVGSARCGETLTDVPSYFLDYHFQLLRLWLSTESVIDGVHRRKVPRPAVAFGSWVLAWLKQNFNIDLKPGEIGIMDVPNIGSVPVIGSFHPAALYRTVSPEWNPDKTDKERFVDGMKIMQQDAIVACWQIQMGKVPDGDPGAVLSSCKRDWKEKTEEICRLLETEGYRKTPDEAKQYCESGVLKNFVYPSDERAAELERLE